MPGDAMFRRAQDEVDDLRGVVRPGVVERAGGAVTGRSGAGTHAFPPLLVGDGSHMRTRSLVDDVPDVAVVRIPTDHAYVRHLSVPGEAGGFHTLPDPAGPLPAGTWSPSPALDPSFFASSIPTD